MNLINKEAPNFKWALPNVAILGLPDHPSKFAKKEIKTEELSEMYEWLLQQGISTLYSVHPQLPKQIKAVPKLENIGWYPVLKTDSYTNTPTLKFEFTDEEQDG